MGLMTVVLDRPSLPDMAQQGVGAGAQTRDLVAGLVD
jgi:hypothetical protein